MDAKCTGGSATRPSTRIRNIFCSSNRDLKKLFYLSCIRKRGSKSLIFIHTRDESHEKNSRKNESGHSGNRRRRANCFDRENFGSNQSKFSVPQQHCHKTLFKIFSNQRNGWNMKCRDHRRVPAFPASGSFFRRACPL